MHLPDRNKPWPMVKGLKKIFQANGLRKQREAAILISNKIDFKPKLVRISQRTSLHINKGNNQS
jgi:hypothetical protein